MNKNLILKLLKNPQTRRISIRLLKSPWVRRMIFKQIERRFRRR